MALILRRASFSPSSYDPETREFEAVISTGAPVRRSGFIEELDLSAIDLDVLAGLPLLDSHRQDGTNFIVGSLVNAWRDGAAIVARFRLSSAPDVESIRTKIAEGDLKSVSIGYSAAKQSERATREGRVVTVHPRIHEVSLVGIPADASANIRMESPFIMTTTTTEGGTTAENENTITRSAQIRTIARSANLAPEWADAQIDSGADMQAVQAAAFEAMTSRTAPVIRHHVGASDSDPAVIRTRSADALAYRMGGLAELPEASRAFMGQSFLDLARDSVARTGVTVRGMSTDEVLQRSMHGTSDFPLVVADAANKTLLSSYKAAETPLKTLGKQRTVPNFKDASSLRLGGMGRLAELSEHGEITATSRAEIGETMSLKTYARRFDLTRKLIIDDDAGAFGDITAALGQAAAQTEADELVALVTGNPVMADGTVVFHASRGNITTGSALDETALSAMRLAMRGRTDLDGKTIIGATPRYLLVGPELETDAEKLLAAIQPAITADVNPFAGKLVLLVEPRISDDSFYVFADPARLPGFSYAYLSGQPGPQIQRQEMWDQLGVSFRVFEDFGCGWVDWRAAQFNGGAA